jgi:hypothetical protein
MKWWKMKMENYFASVAMIVVLSTLLIGIAASQPVSYFPQQFYGTVTINGAPAPDGVLVSAKFQGRDNTGGLTSGGNYGYGIPAFVVQLQEGDEGRTIEFYVQNVKAGQSTFVAGASTRLDLSVTIPNFGSNPGGGSPGGGGGSYVPGGPVACNESWICTDWTECSNSVQKRVCADVNRCNTTVNKPIEKQDCVMPVICTAGETKCDGNNLLTCSALGTTWLQSRICDNGCANGACIEKIILSNQKTEGYPFTGLFLMESGALAYGIAIVIVIALVALYLLRFRGKKK